MHPTPEQRLKATTAPSASDAVHALNASSGSAETIQQRSNPGRAWISYMDEILLEVRVTKMTLQADDIPSFELKNCVGPSLPYFSAGSHVAVYLANGLEVGTVHVITPHTNATIVCRLRPD